MILTSRLQGGSGGIPRPWPTAGSRFSAKAGGLDLVGMAPHGDELGGAGLAGVGEPLLERAPTAPAWWPPWRRANCGRSSRPSAWALFAQALGRIDHLADHAQRQRAFGRHALGAAATRAMRSTASKGMRRARPIELVGGHLSDRHVGVEEGGVGRREHDVGVGHEVQSAAARTSRSPPR